jgi:DNA-binding transcriptional MerR regulator
MAAEGIRIGKVSQETGLSIDTIRFYEKQGLLDRPLRSEGGFRLFDAEDIQRMQFIRRAQQLGFSLAEIRELLVLQREHEPCIHVRELLEAKLKSVRSKIQELRALEEQLAERLRKCNRKSRTHAGNCPVLEEIAHRSSA